MIPDVNKDAAGILKNIECFALDMDGTIYLGEQWIEGAREFLSAVEAAGKRYVFLTNNSSKNPQVYVKKLSRMGLEVTEEKIVTSGQATIAYLKQHFPGKRVFLLGNELLTEEFVQEGIVLDTESPEVVVVGFDTTLTYEKMCRVCDFVREGCRTFPHIRIITARPRQASFLMQAQSMHLSGHRQAESRIILSESRTVILWTILWHGKVWTRHVQRWLVTGFIPMWQQE